MCCRLCLLLFICDVHAQSFACQRCTAPGRRTFGERRVGRCSIGGYQLRLCSNRSRHGVDGRRTARRLHGGGGNQAAGARALYDACNVWVERSGGLDSPDAIYERAQAANRGALFTKTAGN